MSRFIVVCVALCLGGCIDSHQDKATGHYVPPGAKIIQKIDGDWVVFEIEISGRRRRFLSYQDNLNTPVVSITELTPPFEDE